MDVSRIEAFNPGVKINWQMLTAREILRFNDLGVNVPNEYLAWANDFINSVYEGDKDKVTYEMAQSPDFKNRDKTSESLSNEEESVQPEPQNIDTSVSNSELFNNQELSGAQQERKTMTENGISLENQAVEFTNISNVMSDNVASSVEIMNSDKVRSNDEISDLDRQMRIILSQSGILKNDLRNEINKMNSGENYSYQKIISMQNQLLQNGQIAQNDISRSQSEFERLNIEINNQSFSISNASNYGAEAISIGTELLSQSLFNPISQFIGNNAVISGNNAVLSSESGRETQKDVLSVNASNTSYLSEYQNQIGEETGVYAIENDKNINEDTKNNDESPEARLSNPGNASLDEILKRKIRRGMENS